MKQCHVCAVRKSAKKTSGIEYNFIPPRIWFFKEKEKCNNAIIFSIFCCPFCAFASCFTRQRQNFPRLRQVFTRLRHVFETLRIHDLLRVCQEFVAKPGFTPKSLHVRSGDRHFCDTIHGGNIKRDILKDAEIVQKGNCGDLEVSAELNYSGPRTLNRMHKDSDTEQDFY